MILLKIETIPGQSLVTHDTCANAIQLESWSFSLSRSLQSNVSNQERSAGEVHMSEMIFSKVMDSSTNALADACSHGTLLGDIELHITRTVDKTETTYLKYILSEAMVASISSSGSGSDSLPHDSFSINFTKIQSEWTGQGPDIVPAGVVAFDYDAKTKATAA